MRAFLLGRVVAGILGAVWLVGQAPAQGARARQAIEYRLLDDEVEGAFDLSVPVRAPGDGEARICFGYRGPDDCCYLRLTPRELALVRVQGGTERELSRPVEIQPALGAEPATVVIQRRPEKIGVVCRGVLALVVGDADSGTGKVGTACLGKMAVDEPRLQPVEAPAMADDFMRKEGEPGPWETVSGQWSLATVGDVKKSANGFSYSGAGTPAVAVAGNSFWEDYVFQASFKCHEAEGAAGLCLYYQDPRNYLALEWASKEGLRLLRVRDGEEKVIAEKRVAWIPDQWYRLGVQALDGALVATVDGSICLEARDPAFGRGKVALYAEGKDVFFDDVNVKPAVYFHDTDPTDRPERWIEAGAARIIGSPAWQDYSYRVRLEPRDSTGLSLVFGWRGPKDYCVFRWGAQGGRGPGAGRRQIVRVTDTEEVLADAPGGFEPGRAYDLRITFRPGYAAVAVDGTPILETAGVPLDAAGAVGIAPLNGALREVTVVLREPPPPPEEEVTAEFTNSAVHPDMAEWANPAKAWVPKQGAGGTIYWRKGEQFRDTWVSFPLPPMPDGVHVSVALAADSRDLQSGYVVTLGRPGPGKVTAQLQRQGASIESITVETGTDQAVPVALSRQGSHLLADVAGKRVVEFQDAEPLGGSRVALLAQGIDLDLKAVRIATLNAYDYTFHEAPTDWQPQSGVWEITNRWSCQPGWSWFGGKSEEVAAVWNKRRFSGDLVFEYYAAPKMDAVQEAYERRFRDLNATICADGEHLNSGYSVVLGGMTSPRTLLLRGDEVVAETEAFRLPTRDAGHHSWFYVRIEKRGSRVSVSVDNKPLLSYEDPKPLTGDRVALWTRNNGMLLARAVLSYEREGEVTLLSHPAGQAYVRAAAPAVPGGENPPKAAAAQAPPAEGADTHPVPPPATPLARAVPPVHWQRVALTETFDGGKIRAKWDTATGEWMANKDGHFAPTTTPGYACALTGAPEWQDCQVTADLLDGRDAGILLRAKDWDNCVLLVVRPAQKDLWWFVRKDGQWGPLYAVANLDFDQKPLVKVTATAIGDTFTCSLDGREVSRLQDRTFTQGRVGVYINTALPDQAWDNVEVRTNQPAPRIETGLAPGEILAPPAAPEKPRVLLADTFDGGKTRVGWGPAEGRWTATRGGCFAPADKVEYAYALAGEDDWRDYEVRADLINGQDAGIVLRAKDWNDCVFLVLRPAHRDVWWFVRRAGQWGPILAATPLDFDLKPLLKVRVTAVGDTFTCYLDGKQISQIKDPTFTQGKVGLYIHPGEPGQAWDNLEVLPVEPASAKKP